MRKRAEAIDLSVIDLDKFEYNDMVLVFKEPKQIKPDLDEFKQLYTIKDDTLGIDVYAYNRGELKEHLKEQLEFLWISYALEEDTNLTSDALILKNNLLKAINCQGREVGYG